MKKSLTAVLVVLFLTAGFTHSNADRPSTDRPSSDPATESSLSVQAFGPCCIDEIGIYTYVANVSGASGSVSYQWSIQTPGFPTTILGTDQVQDVFVNPGWENGSNVCVEATDGVDEDEDCIFVIWVGD